MNKNATLAKRIKLISTALITPSCESVSKYVSQSMDQPLPLYRRIQIRIHLLGCELCARYRDQLFKMRILLRSDPVKNAAEEESAQLSSAAKKRIKNSLKQR